ncbi:MAG: T9SS type A sorting domain-containing protein [Ignavibacteriae bacterium]|nr:T9SS type A sorting domain-containing protein [Ignavibacteriota bacterium]MCB9216408.1 T9SS type A sorting domain-containing protein [Ignavibacteria bacterium]
MLFSLSTTFASGILTSPPSTIQVGEFIRQQDPVEKPGKISVTVVRSVESESIKVTVYFPQDANSVKISLHNLLGREISVNPTTAADKGESLFQFDTRALSNGPYFVVVEALGQRITKKIMLTR